MNVQQRVVIVTRPTSLQQMIAIHGTRQQAEFFLSTRAQSLKKLEDLHQQQDDALRDVLSAIPKDWRRTRLDRSDLDRFLFEDDDIVVVVGQDGLVANVAKYLKRQPTIGVNPSPDQFEGKLVPFAARQVSSLLRQIVNRDCSMVERTKVVVQLDDGQQLQALNELFIGHESHQSSRYRIQIGERQELQSSSGIIVATGTGSTGWAKSLFRLSSFEFELPGPVESRLVHFTREAWPSRTTGVELTSGELREGMTLNITSRMDWGGVIFGDGIEQDRLSFNWGQHASIAIAENGLCVPESFACYDEESTQETFLRA